MNDVSNLVHHFVRNHAAEAARVLENCTLDELALFFAQTPSDLATPLFDTMESSIAAACLERMPAEEAAAALGGLAADRAAHLVRRLAPKSKTGIQEALPDDFSRHLNPLLRYREETAGALMQSLVFTVQPEVSAGEALSRLQTSPVRVLNYVYVVARDSTLSGVFSLRELLAADEAEAASVIMNRDVRFLRTDDSLAAVTAHPSWKDFHTLPVLDEQDLFAGALRHKTLRQLSRVADRFQHAGQAGAALGELYRIGLTALAKGALGAEDLQATAADQPGR
ncbi:MAG: CBS domain-containing protein [Gemmatimonadota bacterium]|nr:CBS domain-containing protein [Gemmatimonadota bacterium]